MDMETWNNWKEKISDTAAVVGKKSAELVEISKIKFSIMDMENDVKKLMKEIGALVYDAHKGNDDLSDEVVEKCTEIDALYAKIEEAQARMNELKNMKVCTQCKKSVTADCDFCPNCGHVFEASEEPADEETEE